MIAEWTNKYIEIPFLEHGRTPDGVDCWGLAYLIYALEFGINLPSYKTGYHSTNDKSAISHLIEDERCNWYEFMQGQEQIGDIILLSIGGINRHIGMVVGDGYMIHILDGAEVIIEKYNHKRWYNNIVGYYRHEKLLDWECTELSFTGVEFDSTE
jgi:cell wall-associated NlpC family hydrolase